MSDYELCPDCDYKAGKDCGKHDEPKPKRVHNCADPACEGDPMLDGDLSHLPRLSAGKEGK